MFYPVGFYLSNIKSAPHGFNYSTSAPWFKKTKNGLRNTGFNYDYKLTEREKPDPPFFSYW